MFIKRSLLLLTFLTIAYGAVSQNVVVKKEAARIKAEDTDGFAVELQASADEVQSYLSKYLKGIGKTKTADNVVAVNEPMILGKKYVYPLYATTKLQSNTTSAWIGIKPSEWYSDKDVVSAEIENIVYDFGVAFYKDKIQKQIDESTRAYQAVEKQQQRLLNQNRDYNNKVEKNKIEKIELEQSLENNKRELEMLIKKIEQNKKDQDSVAVAGEQIKKVIEMHKERQRNVN